MKLLITLLLFFWTLAANSQGSYNFFYDWDTRQLNENPLSEEMKGLVKEVRIKNTYRKAKWNKSIEKNYDENGLVTLYEVNNQRGELSQKMEAQYNSKGNITLFRNYSDKGIQREKVNSYDNQLRITETFTKNSKGKIRNKSTWTYGDGNCAVSSVRYKKGGQKISRIWNYSFYKDCDPSKTTLSNAKGKILKTWSYDCKKEGEQLTKKKDETQVCKWEESDGKYLIRVFQNFDEKGNVTKTIQKYTLEDTLIIESISYDGSDKIKYKWTYDKSFDRQTSFIRYDKNGMETYHTESLYLDQKIQSSVSISKGKKRSEVFYTYNEKGWLTKIESFDKKDRRIKLQEFEYLL